MKFNLIEAIEHDIELHVDVVDEEHKVLLEAAISEYIDELQPVPYTYKDAISTKTIQNDIRDIVQDMGYKPDVVTMLVSSVPTQTYMILEVEDEADGSTT